MHVYAHVYTHVHTHVLYICTSCNLTQQTNLMVPAMKWSRHTNELEIEINECRPHNRAEKECWPKDTSELC